MDLAALFIGLTLVYFLGVAMGYRHGRITERTEQVVKQRIRELSYYGPATYQSISDGPPVEHD